MIYTPPPPQPRIIVFFWAIICCKRERRKTRVHRCQPFVLHYRCQPFVLHSYLASRNFLSFFLGITYENAAPSLSIVQNRELPNRPHFQAYSRHGTPRTALLQYLQQPRGPSRPPPPSLTVLALPGRFLFQQAVVLFLGFPRAVFVDRQAVLAVVAHLRPSPSPAPPPHTQKKRQPHSSVITSQSSNGPQY